MKKIWNAAIFSQLLMNTKRQVYKWKFLQHALSRYVYNRNLYVIFTKVKMAEE